LPNFEWINDGNEADVEDEIENCMGENGTASGFNSEAVDD